MTGIKLTRKQFLVGGLGLTAGSLLSSPFSLLCCSSPADDPDSPPYLDEFDDTLSEKTAVVSIARIDDGRIDRAVEQAIDLLGGIETVTAGKDRIMLKPNVVSEDRRSITKTPVIETLGRMMKGAGKEVCIGEGSASAWLYNADDHGNVCRLSDEQRLNDMQQYVFRQTGYAGLSEALGIPLVNLHTGPMVTVPVPDGFVYRELELHQELTEIDLLCSVPMMKTHTLATVTLGIKNLFGVIPGTVYGTVRAHVHDVTSEVDPTGTDATLIDLIKATKTGLVVVDASMAMEGDGPTNGKLVEMNLIIAGTNPLATDMVSAALMGFAPWEVPTFGWAHRAGLGPDSLRHIEVRGAPAREVWQRFERPDVVPWQSINKWWGNEVCAYRKSKTGLMSS